MAVDRSGLAFPHPLLRLLPFTAVARPWCPMRPIPAWELVGYLRDANNTGGPVRGAVVRAASGISYRGTQLYRAISTAPELVPRLKPREVGPGEQPLFLGFPRTR
jgi:hypothetical protein